MKPYKEEEIDLYRLITFYLEDQYFAIPVKSIREVLMPTYITPLMHAPDEIEGVINLRGHIVMILNLKAVFDIPDKWLMDQTKRIIILDNNGKISGIVADRIEISVDVAKSLVAPPQETGLEALMANCIGTVEMADKTLTIIDVERLHRMPAVLEMEYGQ